MLHVSIQDGCSLLAKFIYSAPKSIIQGMASGVTAFALGMAFAAPLAITAAVNALGFTATGIAGGSTAAAMMSAEAIAAGGGVAAGWTVATLQSIGAVGLGVMGTIGTMAGGLATGTALGAAAVGTFGKK
mmetsp:Transcript_36596/g.51746  ORF Transcript_36596/g.51746 Transcript_36596/m.51746 type:complete len:130 (+) Transcript_36596:297-686(+)|eukprot:CAMPEP_0202458490 /NCGR_PEP_ID=MMETSP1360-20130828/26006_1 /ASSEMBLY_ACC=CAM_ASM_000848 /TAXON_ID=515479 /ORGANISM="Licmophora paradoxa, Strain CCMP2313" /LENGTH=129 /DNA_ID=CAMNT_0049079067 /DNA_START=71 /DNA_END=460 /DNA_ORIENTATION=-